MNKENGATPDERAAFEAWAKLKFPQVNLTRGSGGGYVKALMQVRWEVWQARASLAQPAPAAQPEQQPIGFVGLHVESAIKGQTRYTTDIRARKSKGYPIPIYTAPVPAAAPEPLQGWKLVPVEPTQEMLDNTAAFVNPHVNEADCAIAYRAMLAAAPIGEKK